MQSSSEEAETFREGVDSQKNRIGCACVQRHTILPVRPLRTPMRLACAYASGAHIDSKYLNCQEKEYELFVNWCHLVLEYDSKIHSTVPGK